MESIISWIITYGAFPVIAALVALIGWKFFTSKGLYLLYYFPVFNPQFMLILVSFALGFFGYLFFSAELSLIFLGLGCFYARRSRIAAGKRALLATVYVGFIGFLAAILPIAAIAFTQEARESILSKNTKKTSLASLDACPELVVQDIVHEAVFNRPLFDKSLGNDICGGASHPVGKKIEKKISDKPDKAADSDIFKENLPSAQEQ